jgi:hypothetical protein
MPTKCWSGFSAWGEERGNAVTLSGTQLASSLLRDNSFSLVSIGLSHENTYTVDLNSETLHMRTRLYAVMSGRTSFFKVEIAGKISGGTFVVRNPVHGTVIMQVEEERFRQAFFPPRWRRNVCERKWNRNALESWTS